MTYIPELDDIYIDSETGEEFNVYHPFLDGDDEDKYNFLVENPDFEPSEDFDRDDFIYRYESEHSY